MQNKPQDKTPKKPTPTVQSSNRKPSTLAQPLDSKAIGLVAGGRGIPITRW